MDYANKEFIKYTDKYKKYGEKIELKIKHTFRVQKLCEEIAKSINLNEEEIKIASLCGLLHDIGRFEQWKKTKNYNDNKELDHGELGYLILKENNYIRKFNKDKKYDEIILKAVRYHNKYKIPNDLDNQEKLFVNITRDADKLDLLYLYKIGIFKISKDNIPFNEDIYNNILDKKLVSKELIKNDIDMDALRIGFIFDLNFKYSYELINKENYMNDTIDKQLSISDNKDLIEQLNNIKVLVNNYIEEMITC